MSLLLEALKRAERQRQDPPPPPPRPPEDEAPPTPPAPKDTAILPPAEAAVPQVPLPVSEAIPAEPAVEPLANQEIAPPCTVEAPSAEPAASPSVELSLEDIPPPAASASEAIQPSQELLPDPESPAPSLGQTTEIATPEPLLAEPVAPPSPPPQADRVDPTSRGEETQPVRPAPSPFASADQRERVRTLLGASHPPAKLSTERKRQLVLGGTALVVALGTAGALLWIDQQTATVPIVQPPVAQEPSPEATVRPSPEEAAPATPAASPSAEPLRQEDTPAKAAKAGSSDLLPAPVPSGSRPRTATELSAAPSPRPAPSPVSIRRNDVMIVVHPATEAGYAALASGNLGTARQQYQEALKSDQRNRDAILGLAVTALREGHAEEAARRYQQLLELDPRDADANAGLALLRGVADPVTYESRLRILIEERGDNAALHHALGSLLARQNRWGEAQEAFFRAVTLAPRAADYLFNLAVALDHLGQYAQARSYYRKALEQTSGAGTFNRESAQARLATIEARTP